eukprot:6743773-Pyramimonas_sp.AAC.1
MTPSPASFAAAGEHGQAGYPGRDGGQRVGAPWSQLPGDASHSQRRGFKLARSRRCTRRQTPTRHESPRLGARSSSCCPRT